jgi:hypothetical protein
MDRREFGSALLKAAATALFAQRVYADKLLQPRASKRLQAWVAAHQDIASQLAAGRITGRQWQSDVARLAHDVSIEELLDQIDFDKIASTLDLSSPGGTKKFVRLPHPDDPSLNLTYGAAIFGLQKNYAITPHAHRNMVSAHMVIKGELHVRNFDRVGAEQGHVIVDPTVDAVIRRGDVSTMSTERNNVHWFTARTPAAFTLDIIVDSLVPNDEPYVIELLDVRNAEKLANGHRRARIIDWKESVRLYGIE